MVNITDIKSDVVRLRAKETGGEKCGIESWAISHPLNSVIFYLLQNPFTKLIKAAYS